MAFAEAHKLISISELRNTIAGEVITPEDAAYDSARATWNVSINQQPAVIVVATNPIDIVEAVQYARVNNLAIAMKATGHGVILPADNAMLIVTSKMTNVTIDAEAQTARIEAGAQWAVALEAAQKHGLAPLLGSSSGVGAVGYTLGGGMGWLARKYGLSIDSVVEFEVVTMDGRMLRVNNNENTDLFWAMRGGGGTFAIVTAMTVRLYPVATVYGGTLIYPIELAKEALLFFAEWTKWLPDAFTASIAIMNMPPIPELPPFLSGKSVVMVNGCYAGPANEGRMLVQPWLDWKAPIVDGFHEMPFSTVDIISNDPKDPLPGLSSGAWLAHINEETVDTVLAFALPAGGPPALLKTEIRYAGGAIARVPRDVNAYSHRSANYVLQMVGLVPTPEIKRGVSTHIAEFKKALTPHLTGGVYMNFLEGTESREKTVNGFEADKFRRLTEIKAKYDPDNLLRLGYKIPAVGKA